MLLTTFLINLFVFFVEVSSVSDYIYYPEVKMYYKFHRQPQKWVDARYVCLREGGELAMPRNASEAAVLHRVFSGYPPSMLRGVLHPNFFLLNFHDMFKEGEYVTDKGVPIQYYYHIWAGGQPDNTLGNENCGSMFRAGGLNDYNCNVPAVFICQKNAECQVVERNLYCINPDPAYQYSEKLHKCYKLHMDPRIWSDARAICRAEGGHLAIINSKEEENFLVSMFVKPEDRVNHVRHRDFALIGFHDIFRENYFVTVNGEELHQSGHVRWAGGQPDNAGAGENCGTLHIAGGLNDFNCFVPAVFFCETEPSLFALIDKST